MFKPFTIQEKENIEKEYERLFKINDINEEIKEKYKMLLQNVHNYNKYVSFKENCKIINAINKLEEVGSHVKTIVLKSDMNNIKEGMVLDIYSFNELYVKDYQETKDNRKIEVSHIGTRTIVNPFKNVEILIVIEKDNNITFVDKFDFCSRTELKPYFYEALKYHYVPSVIKEIEEAIEADNEKYEIYQFEVGILLQEDDEAYKNVWDFKHSYYNENWGFAKTYEEAKDYVDSHIEDGCNNSYGIISKLEVTYEEYKSIYNGWSDSIDLDYDLNNIVYNACKKDNTIIEDFIDLKHTNKLCSEEQWEEI